MSEVKRACSVSIRVLLLSVLTMTIGLIQAESASAQLMACDQIDGGGALALPPGSCIARSLEDQIDLGHTPTYLSLSPFGWHTKTRPRRNERRSRA